jgi:alpha-L-fucosidase
VRRALVLLLLGLALIGPGGARPTLAATTPPRAQTVPLGALFNSQAVADAQHRQANFDGTGEAFPADELPPPGRITLGGVPYDFPSGGPDAVVALGQTIGVPPDHYATAYWLLGASYGPAGGPATLQYADGSRSTAQLEAPDWVLNGGSGALTTPDRWRADGPDHLAPASLYSVSLPIDPARVLVSITLPVTARPARRTSSLHVFALTLQPTASGIAPAIVEAVPTNTSLADGSQTISVRVRNLGRDWITPADPVTVSLDGPGLETTQPATIAELGPVEDIDVTVGVQVGTPDPQGPPIPAQVTASARSGAHDSLPVAVPPAIALYEATDASLARHQSPDWFNGAKFGIFIHWGAYSVPAWAPSGAAYAEWYWYWMNQPGNPVAVHHLQTYGPDVAYDDFLDQFTASQFDPLAWVALFQQAGARYFVLTAKHHDGIALFRDRYSHRNTVDLGPHRDLVRELFAAAAQAAPDLKRGLYYSLPEWYNPAYPGPFDRFSGGPPYNPYTGAPVPYTGYVPVDDYVQDYQAPQLDELITDYDPDLLWCDIGGPNDSLDVLATFYNQAVANGKQVAADDRCGIAAHDFVTHEYSKQALYAADKWEENRGLDPYSYGYNAATPEAAYVSADAVIRELVDVTSKNGNLLLGIGPRADGSIPAVMADRLRAVGAWLGVNGEAIYDTRVWSRAQQERTGDEDLRFTLAPNRALYVIDLHAPGPQEIIWSPVPIRAGDQITLLGYPGGPLAWRRRPDGALVIDVPSDATASLHAAWTFKIAWQP